MILITAMVIIKYRNDTEVMRINKVAISLYKDRREREFRISVYLCNFKSAGDTSWLESCKFFMKKRQPNKIN